MSPLVGCREQCESVEVQIGASISPVIKFSLVKKGVKSNSTMAKTFTFLIYVIMSILAIVSSLQLTYNLADYMTTTADAGIAFQAIFDDMVQQHDSLGIDSTTDFRGGYILIPPGKFELSTPVVIDKSFITIEGSNYGWRSGTTLACITIPIQHKLILRINHMQVLMLVKLLLVAHESYQRI